MDRVPHRGDVYYIDFDPPLDPHYAVVVTANALNSSSSSVVVAVITSKNADKVYPHEFKLPQDTLNKPSKVRCDSLIMTPKENLKSENWSGTLSKKDMEGLDVALMKALDLWY